MFRLSVYNNSLKPHFDLKATCLDAREGEQMTNAAIPIYIIKSYKLNTVALLKPSVSSSNCFYMPHM